MAGPDPDAIRELQKWVERTGGSASVRVIDLMDLFGLTAWNSAAKDLVNEALEKAGLDARDPVEGLERWYSVRLSSRDAEIRHEAERSRVFAALPSGELRELESVDAGIAYEGQVWVDLGDHDLARLGEVVARLVARPGEDPSVSPVDTEEIVKDLLKPDARPRVHVFGERAAVRTSSFVEVNHKERDDDHASDSSKAGALSVDLVEFVTGETFLLTRRSPPEILTGGLRTTIKLENLADLRRPALDQARLVREVRRRWARAGRRAAQAERTLGIGDLGMLVAHELSESLEKSRRALATWLDHWELEWLDPDRGVERATVAVVRALVDEFHDRLAPLQYPYGNDPVLGWFAGVHDENEAKHVHALITRTLRDLEAMKERVRGAFDLLEITVGDHTRRRIEVIGFALLLPSLIAGIFGANTFVPGQAQEWGFALMLLVMALSIAGTLLLFHDRSGSLRDSLAKRFDGASRRRAPREQ